MKIVKVIRDIFPEISLDNFNRQQKITRIYVKKGDTYVLEEQPGVMDWSIDKKREVAQDLMDSKYISACPSEETIHFYKAMGAEVTNNPIMAIAEDEPDDLQMVCKIN